MRTRRHWILLLIIGFGCLTTVGAGDILAQSSDVPPQPAKVSGAKEFVSVPVVAEWLDQISISTLYTYIGGLSGEWPVIVGDNSYTFETRYSYAVEPISMAMQFAHEHFTDLGLSTTYHTYLLDGQLRHNVVAEQPGELDPERVFLITAHLDSISNDPYGTAPGADDNASGSVAVMMAADVLHQVAFPYTVRYVLFSGEEQGLIGSHAYAEHVAAEGDDIRGLLNLDMISYNADSAPIVDLHTRSTVPGSLEIARTFTEVVKAYDLELLPEVLIDNWLGNYSDHKPFWDQGYPAILAIEDYDDFSPYYHTTEDQLATLDFAYYREFVRAAVGTLVHMVGVSDFVYVPTQPSVGLAVTFTGISTLVTSPMSYTWNFGDGSGLWAGNPVSHTYPQSSWQPTYTVIMTTTVGDQAFSRSRMLVLHERLILYLPIVIQTSF